jgi:hypothetical protein
MVHKLSQYYSNLPNYVQNNIIHLVGAGNGIRKNQHLIKAAELKYGKSLILLNQSEESCLGVFINAGKGIGVYSNYSDGALEIVKYNEKK